MTSRGNWTCAVGVALAFFAGCKKKEATKEEAPATEAPAAETPPPSAEQPSTDPAASGDTAAAAGASAAAELKPASGSKVAGSVTFTEKDGKVEVAIELAGLSAGDHGFHVHEKGDCSAPDATSAGPHFNPGNHPHGSPDDPADKHHAGDFGNITAGADGTVKTVKTVDFITVAEGERSVVGRAVVVHEKPDDLKSQPTGEAGGRIACGVVEKK